MCARIYKISDCFGYLYSLLLCKRLGKPFSQKLFKMPLKPQNIDLHHNSLQWLLKTIMTGTCPTRLQLLQL